MAFPSTYNFNYYRGDTFSFILSPKTSTGAAFDLANYYSKMTITDGTPLTATISDATLGSGSVTYEAINHPFSVGQTVTISGITPTTLNTSSKLVTGITENSFTIAATLSGDYTSGGTATTSSKAVANTVITSEGEDQYITATITPQLRDVLTPGVYDYDLEIYKLGGGGSTIDTVYTLLAGRITVIADITETII